MNSNNLYNGNSGSPFVLGLTGGIGTGKSTAAEYIVSKGFEHIDADAIGHELTVTGSPVLRRLEETFAERSSKRSFLGKPTVINADGSLDRKALAAIVFSDPEEKKKLDGIMFPEISRVISERIEDAGRWRKEGEPGKKILLDAPLLFESGLDRLCTKVILLTCDMDTRIDRVTERDDASREEVNARIRSQMSDEEKRSGADFIVDNSGSIHSLRAQIDDILSEI